ncbi:hypothetical protein Esi_0065_0011 [Ectocarpus siliculosus]|uniref:WW domain-containing protein n=1 Tax=Ectocarpus siliculosus TaxID=2880 RepID=D7G5G6_ECTSI|nr:hypothetical protein Esi_0065_0011 [Ectocarpus siliculosus]|eukprot:CBJ27289.1 hypothetical protein Esi_0065_0011 [Ectocarpus siliculosus]
MSESPASWVRHDDTYVHDGVSARSDWSNDVVGATEENNYYNAQDQTTWENGAHSYGYDTGAAYSAQDGNSTWLESPSDMDWEQQVANNVEATPDEWQWVQNSSTEGYFYNSVTGEARWDDPAAFEEANSHELVERGYNDALATEGVPIGETLTEYYGQGRYTFTAEDGTVWSYDEALGDYVQHHDDQESSWEPPPEWQENPVAEDYYSSTYENGVPDNDGGVAELQQPGRPAITGDESNEEGGTLHYAPPQETALEPVPTGGAGSASIAQPEGRKGYDENDGAASTGIRSERSSQPQENDTHGDMASAGPRSSGPRSSGDNSSLDQTSADEFSQWSLAKLRGVSKMLPGKWPVSDFLVDRATEDYDMMLTLNASEIEAFKNKGTSQIIRSLVGPEDGEDDDQDDLSLSSDSCETADDPYQEDQLSASVTAGHVEYPTAQGFLGKSSGGITTAGTTSVTSFPGSSPGDAGDGVVANGGKKKAAASVTGSESVGKNREISPTRRPVEGKGLRPGRRGSLLGLDRAKVDNEGKGLGGWKPGFAEDGSLYFINQETGEVRWTFPVRAWEVRVRQLALLTPRAPLEVGRGVCRLRETSEMKKKRLAHRWKVEQILAQEALRREEDPTPAEAAQDAMESIITAIERREDKKRRRREHNIRALERARWHPSTSGYLMQRLAVSASTTVIATARANELEEGPEGKMILTDADFLDINLTQGRGLATALHFSLPARLLQPRTKWAGLLAAPDLPTPPSLRALAGVRSLGDLKRELTALGTAARAATATPANQEQAMATEGGGTIGGNALSSMKARAWKRKIKATAAEPADTASKDEEALVDGDTPVPATAVAVRTQNDETSTALGRPDGVAPAAAPPLADSPPTRNAEPPAEHDGATAATGKRSRDDHNKPSNDGGDSGSSSSSAKGSFATTKSPSGVTTAVRPASVPNGGVKDSKGQAGTGNEEEESRQQSEKGPPSPRVLTAVAPLDEQVRGFGAKLALKIEIGDLDPKRAGDAVAAMAKKRLVAAGKAMGLPNKVATTTKVPEKPGRVLTPQPPPPDVSTITIELACTPPPFNLLTTVKVEDPATGKKCDREELTSVLRDAWEGMLVRDIAMAGGVDPRQVIVEEVRRRRVSKVNASADASPFRPERRDETFRRYAGTEHAVAGMATTTTSPAPARAEGLVAPCPTSGQRQEEQLGSGTERLLAPASDSLPQAGLRATMTRRLRPPVAKKRRLGRGWAGRGGSGVGDDGREQASLLDDLNGELSRASPQLGEVDRRAFTAPSLDSPSLGVDEVVGASGTPREPVAGSSGPQKVLLPRIANSSNGFSSDGAWNSPREGAGDAAFRRRGTVVNGSAPWKGMNFADMNVADDHAVGIGAGNRGDFGILGRIQQRGGRFVGSLGHMQEVFEPVDEGRTQDPE